MSADTGVESGGRWHGLPRRLPRLRTVLLVALALLAVLWLAPMIVALVDDIDLEELERPALIVFGFVAFEAVIPVFPSESLLTAASTLAAQTGSDIELWRVILAGGLGAAVGDSLLYWLSRTVLRRSMRDRLDRATEDERVARALGVLGDSAPLLIVFGRFVPGLRFVVGATMGISRYPYRRFVVFDLIGGMSWSLYTCVFSYLMASLIDDKPLASILASALVTTVVLAVLYRPIKRRWDAADPGAR
jgi:membrane-associated protein